MAEKEKRQWGSGSIVTEKHGLAIRWPEYVKGKDGKPRRKMRYEFVGAVSAKEAGKRLTAKIAAAQKTGPLNERNDPTFKEHAERWVRDVLPHGYKFSTRRGYASDLRKHLVPHFGSWRVSMIGTADFQEFVTSLQVSGYAPHSIRHYRETFRVVMREAVTWYNLPKNPVVGIRTPKIRAIKPKWALSPEQSGKLLGRLNAKARAMVALAIITGMRRGELLALRWSSLDESVSQVEVCQAYYMGHLDTPKTAAGIRSIPIDQWMRDVLFDWRRVAKRTKPEHLIFGTRTGKPENPNNILRRHVFPACEALGVPRATWLTFRRTFSTLAQKHGIPPKTIAAIMGHADLDTQAIYIQPIDEMARVAAGRIEEDLSRFCPDRRQMGIPFVN